MFKLTGNFLIQIWRERTWWRRSIWRSWWHLSSCLLPSVWWRCSFRWCRILDDQEFARNEFVPGSSSWVRTFVRFESFGCTISFDGAILSWVWPSVPIGLGWHSSEYFMPNYKKNHKKKFILKNSLFKRILIKKNFIEKKNILKNYPFIKNKQNFYFILFK